MPARTRSCSQATASQSLGAKKSANRLSSQGGHVAEGEVGNDKARLVLWEDILLRMQFLQQIHSFDGSPHSRDSPAIEKYFSISGTPEDMIMRCQYSS
ncbi:unnamed protein product [Cylicocyclus nassatus]|uniref:Uncharacterized protein n=1 Tax=Cylicocyclus nassatus TaxID=53992 RepID=A0AA36H0J5_CYLNA|nr:unnamed protein product [Cylicocyclus nassatus]